MIKKIILYLVRKRLGVKKGQYFYFNNQASDYDRYFFSDYGLMKCTVKDDRAYLIRYSNINLNFLINEESKELIVRENGYVKD